MNHIMVRITRVARVRVKVPLACLAAGEFCDGLSSGAMAAGEDISLRGRFVISVINIQVHVDRNQVSHIVSCQM